MLTPKPSEASGRKIAVLSLYIISRIDEDMQSTLSNNSGWRIVYVFARFGHGFPLLVRQYVRDRAY